MDSPDLVEAPISERGRLKMADIARMAGVSISTVSRALAGNPLIPKTLREEIVEIAQTNGYVVNQSARSLRLRRTDTIGVIIPLAHEAGQLISDPFFLEMVGRLADEITRDYSVLLNKVASSPAGLAGSHHPVAARRRPGDDRPEHPARGAEPRRALIGRWWCGAGNCRTSAIARWAATMSGRSRWPSPTCRPGPQAHRLPGRDGRARGGVAARRLQEGLWPKPACRAIRP
jgi:hypothetical protein